jgi:hypothetical protein
MQDFSKRLILTLVMAAITFVAILASTSGAAVNLTGVIAVAVATIGLVLIEQESRCEVQRARVLVALSRRKLAPDYLSVREQV